MRRSTLKSEYSVATVRRLIRAGPDARQSMVIGIQMNNTARTIGISERMLNSILLGVCMQFVAWGWITGDMAPYYATGISALIFGAYGWWVNRPSKLLDDAKSANTPSAMMDAAATTVPKNAGIVITTMPAASHAEKAEVRAIADAASAKVFANTAA